MTRDCFIEYIRRTNEMEVNIRVDVNGEGKFKVCDGDPLNIQAVQLLVELLAAVAQTSKVDIELTVYLIKPVSTYTELFNEVGRGLGHVIRKLKEQDNDLG